MPVETLHQLILTRGLDACSEIVTAATPGQLNALLDMDLWRPARSGRDEQFDVERFGEWLEVLADADLSSAARTIAALDRDLVVEGLSRYVRVFDPGIFEPTAQSDDELTERRDAMLEGGGIGIECEVGGYLIRARRTNAWDAIVALLVALDTEYPGEFHSIMRGCRSLSNSDPEASGFHDLLLAQEQHLHDVRIGRERRRSQQGYATLADARAFLDMARHSRGARSNPIVAAYFRAADEAPESAIDTPRLALPPGESHSSEAPPEDPLFARGRELAFLANTLLAGSSVQSRPFTPREASDGAAAICHLGLEHWPTTSPATLRTDHDLITAFELGWSMLHCEVSRFAADQLIAMLGDVVPVVDPELRLRVVALRRTLMKYRDSPWQARDAAEILASLDVTAWIGVLGVLDECPIVPAALTAVCEGRRTTVSPTEFQFISTAAQLDAVRMFIHKLPEVWSR